jgi:hypothetical protein
MSGAAPNGPLNQSWGGPLTDSDYAKLERSWITRELADQALLRRVTSPEGASIVGRHDNGSYEGILFPYIWPGENHVRDYWLRRDRPEVEPDSKGQLREKNKYLGPPGRGNRVYIMPGTRAELLDDPRVPIAITEGAKKTIALYQLAHHGVDRGLEFPRFLPIGLAGVWSFLGKVGKLEGANGATRDEKGWIPDLARLRWEGRRVYVVYDSNVQTNEQVAAARRTLTRELLARNAQVLWVNVPSTVARVA